jgi:hypothetical protein
MIKVGKLHNAKAFTAANRATIEASSPQQTGASRKAARTTADNVTFSPLLYFKLQVKGFGEKGPATSFFLFLKLRFHFFTIREGLSDKNAFQPEWPLVPVLTLF